MIAAQDRTAREALRSPVCGSALKVAVEVPPRGWLHRQDDPLTKYFRCISCGQIQIGGA